MKKIIFTLIVTSCVLFGQKYTIAKENSNAFFEASTDFMIVGSDDIVGINKDLSGHMELEDGEIKSLGFALSASGFETKNKRRDSHIKEILNSQTHPYITFEFVENSYIDNQLYIKGLLSVNGVTKLQSIPVQTYSTNEDIVLQGQITVKYEDFDITPPTLGGFMKKAKEDLKIGGKFTFKK